MATETIEAGEGPAGADGRANRRTQIWVAIIGAVGRTVELIGRVEGDLRGREPGAAVRRDSGSNQPRVHPCEVTALPATAACSGGPGTTASGEPVGRWSSSSWHERREDARYPDRGDG